MSDVSPVTAFLEPLILMKATRIYVPGFDFLELPEVDEFLEKNQKQVRRGEQQGVAVLCRFAS